MNREGAGTRARVRSEQGDAYGETWVYESIVGALPGIDLSTRAAVALQFAVFEGGLLALAALSDNWNAVPAGTAAVFVAAAGSVFMLALGGRIRRLRVSGPYRRLLFGTSIEVVLGLLAYVALLTYLFAGDAATATGPTLVERLLGPEPSLPAVYLMLLVLWDLCYRIGTGWWTSLVGCWRSIRYGSAFDAETRAAFRRIDLLTIGFAAVQLLLVPFVWGSPPLVAALVGHVLAVTVVSGLSVMLLS